MDLRVQFGPRRLRICVALALCGLLVVVAGGAFDAVQWPLFIAAGVPGLTGLAVVHRRWVLRLSTALASVAVGVVATVVLAGGSFADATRSVVQGPRRLLTTEWPSPVVASVVGAVALLVAVTTAVAVELAGRRRLHLAPLAAIGVGWVAALAIGAPVRPPIWILVAGGVGALLLALITAESAVADRTLRSDRTLAVSAAAIAVATVAAAGAVAWADRADPRRTQEAEVNAPVIDPIEASVALRRADPPFSVFEITDRSRVVGQSLPARWRIAALDTYDGQRWVPQLALRPIGGRLGLPVQSGVELPPAIDYVLEYESDDIDLLPFPGPPLSASVDVETDLDRVAVRPLERPGVGTRVEISSEVALTSRSSIIDVASPRPVDEIAGGFSDEARRLGGGEGTALEQLRRIESAMRDDWQLDRDAPGAGQQLALIERFIVDTNRGTREQFVTGFVLLARALGVQARVATGFVVPPEALGSPLTLESSMADTWPEVRFQSVGWVAFDPVPPLESTEDEEDEPRPEAQTPAAAQPPIAPPADDPDTVDDETVELTDASRRWADVRRWLGRIGLVGATGMLPIALAIAAVLGYKWRRRRSRLHDPDPARRIRGVWANVTDALVDAGITIAPSWTNDRIATSSTTVAPGVPHELRRLASMSDQVTFGSASPAGAMADDAVVTGRAVERAIRTSRSRWERVRWRLSLRSLRPSTRSPLS